MVGRARRVTGPYVDDHGRPMLDGAARQVLGGYGRYRGPGGQSILVEGKTYWLVYHYYDAADGGISKLQIRPLCWTSTGWPEPGPPIIS
jgi:arabinan endo-1,5-alpha-L-arabinosidase